MNDNNPTYAAGWYADVNAPGTERYYDGAAWTEHSRPASAHAAAEPTPVAVQNSSAKAPWFKRKAIVIPVGVLAGLIVLGSIGSAMGGGKREPVEAAEKEVVVAAPVTEEVAAAEVSVPETTGLTAKEAAALIENAGLEFEFSADKGVVIDRDNWTVLSTTPASGTTAKAGDTIVVNVEKKAAAAAPAPAPAEPAKPSMTTAQSSAVRSAESYLKFKGFSRAGLTEQLTSEYGEGFAAEDAEFAIAYIESAGKVDWNEQAVKSAKSYLDFKGFSRDGLFDQLTSEYGEKFTADQANFALSAVGL
ncbi:Ltp family lipoprotein [Microbacterium testaceum]|uniref:Ltp family lipoprotein n=1 Tax=Microbacterium testaceum TaxID=2033 RepID=UPI00177FF4B3|nr:Ltp family lipoprotein [Microbacterium testaceum]